MRRIRNFLQLSCGLLLFMPGAALFSFEIGGTVLHDGDGGILYIYLVTEEDMDTPFTGTWSVEYRVEEGKSKTIYLFSDIPAGEYGIRLFLDQNGNRKLDRGIGRPKEPWALSWQEKRRMIPRFDDIAFSLSSDMVLDFDISQLD